MPHTIAEKRGALHVIPEKYKCRMCSSERTAGLAWYFLYLSNRAAAISALRLPHQWCTNCIVEYKNGPSPGIFLILFQCCGVSVQVLSSGIIANTSST